MTNYNPMSNEFKDECKKLGLTGNQLTAKYKREGKSIKKGKYKIKTCCNCRSHDTYIDSNGYECWFKHNCQKAICTYYMCKNCYDKHDPNSQNNMKKSLQNCRTGNKDPSSSNAKGDDFEELTSIWKGSKILSIEYDKYCGPLDHSVDSEGRIPQTTGRWCDYYNIVWIFTNLDREWDKIFDYEIFYCASKDGKDIDRIYEFPKLEIVTRNSITITKNPKIGRYSVPTIPWYEKYRITDKDTIKRVNKIWKKIINKKIIK